GGIDLSMRRRSRIVLVSQLVLGLAAASTGFAGRLQLEVSAAVPGTALDVAGSGLDGTNTPVPVGGRPAAVLSGDTTRVRIVVPELRPGRKPVVAQTASGKLKARLRVLRPFDGTLKVKPERRHAAKATIGPGGGTVSTEVHGITYALDVPAGALAADTEITVTPAARIKNLPLTGEKPAAVIFAPGDLTFAIPATLRITHPGGAPANALGFTFDSGTGQAFTLVGATTSGGALELQIR